MTIRLTPKGVAAFSVHLFTASGAFLAFMAMLAAMRGAWAEMFAWLGVALIVDGIDGPIARRLDVKTYAARWSGELLDLIVDYLTYVFIPAVALVTSGEMFYPLAIPGAAIIIMTGAIYFADTRMKTNDDSFAGFPGCWNMVVLVLFAIEPNFWVSLSIVVALAVLMFLPVKFVHPVRTVRWRWITLPMALAWTFFGGWAAWVDFHPESWAHWGLIVTSVYLISAGAVQQLLWRERLTGE
ncbi:MAG: CDP-alcohol phosphatidyltransferase family protein [Pseudomonadota bacterium]